VSVLPYCFPNKFWMHKMRINCLYILNCSLLTIFNTQAFTEYICYTHQQWQ
jgi:hypothetical protein